MFGFSGAQRWAGEEALGGPRPLHRSQGRYPGQIHFLHVCTELVCAQCVCVCMHAVCVYAGAHALSVRVLQVCTECAWGMCMYMEYGCAQSM